MNRSHLLSWHEPDEISLTTHAKGENNTHKAIYRCVFKITGMPAAKMIL